MAVCLRSKVSCIRARYIEENRLEGLSLSRLEIISLAKMLGKDGGLELDK